VFVFNPPSDRNTTRQCGTLQQFYPAMISVAQNYIFTKTKSPAIFSRAITQEYCF